MHPEPILARIASLPSCARRGAFFEAIERQPLHSPERLALVQLGRSRFARGPYSKEEFAALGGFAPSETPTKKEAAIE